MKVGKGILNWFSRSTRDGTIVTSTTHNTASLDHNVVQLRML